MTIQERYTDYLEKFGLAYQKPMSFEAYQSYAAELDAKNAKIEKLAMQAMAHYQGLIRATENKDDALELVEVIKETYTMLYAAAKSDDEATAHVKAFEAVKAQLLMPYKRTKNGHRRPFVASNVYDDDDRPSTLR